MGGDHHTDNPGLSRAGHWRSLTALTAVGVVLLASCAHAEQPSARPSPVSGPLAEFLRDSTDLGASHGRPAQLTVGLYGSTRPNALITWAADHRLSVLWREGEDWAYVSGASDDLGRAFGVDVHDYRSQDGQVFYASQQDPEVPMSLRAEVSGLGRIINYNPIHTMRPPMPPPRDVPDGELKPAQLLNTYNATPLKTTGKGQTIVFIEIDKFDPKDIAAFNKEFSNPDDPAKIPPLNPTVVGQTPDAYIGETTMDIQVAHGIAPDAQIVVYYVPTRMPPPDGEGANWANFFSDIDNQFPHAIWSVSLGGWCDKIDKEVSMRPSRSAIAAAQKRGTTVFFSSGDTGGYECKGQASSKKSSPPKPTEIGLSTIASLPEVVDVGGTTLSTDANGRWVTEVGWADYPATQGTGGGVSNLFDRPAWQQGLQPPEDSGERYGTVPDVAGHRLAPDVAAVADPATGPLIFTRGGKRDTGGGTSVSAPIWAALTALMNQYLTEHGGAAVGDLNPLLYQVAAKGTQPSFHDVTIGGNAAFNSGTGFDLATGLGTPDTMNLVNGILGIQKAGG